MNNTDNSNEEKILIQKKEKSAHSYILSFTNSFSPLRFSLFVNFILFSLTYLLFTPYFQTNDDVGMMLISSGTSQIGTPSEYVFFTNIFIGKILKALYLFSSTTPWYGLYLITVLYFSYSLIFYRILKNNISNRAFISVIYFLFFICAAKFTLLSLQFTIVAGLSGIAGFSIVVFTLNADTFSSLFKYNKAIYAGLLFIVLSAMIRFESMILSGLLFVPVITLKLYEDHKTSFRSVLLAVLAMGAGFILNKYNDSIYAKQNNYVQFNSMRGEFVDNEIMNKNTPEVQMAALKQAGWSVNDYEMMKSWYFMDENLYNVNTFGKALSVLKKIPDDASLQKVYQNISKVYATQKIYFKSAFILLITLLLLISLNYKTFKLMISAVVFSFLVIVALQFYLKPPPLRILYTVATGLLIVVQLVINGDIINELLKINENRRVSFYIVAFILFTTLMVNTTKSDKFISKDIHRKNAAIRKTIDELTHNNETLYVIWANSFYFEGIAPLENINYLKNFHIFSLGTMQRMPYSIEVLKKYNAANLYTGMATNDNIKLILGNSHYNFKYLDKLNIFMKEHYNKTIICKQEKLFDHFGVYAVKYAQ